MDFEHRLVFVFPTALYFLSVFIKALIVNRGNKLTEIKTDEQTAKDLKSTFFKDFIIIVSCESIFLSMANGFIMIVEFNLYAIGALLLCSGTLISVLLLISCYVGSDNICVVSLIGIFSLKSFDVFNFVFLKIEYFKYFTTIIFIIISLLFGILFGVFVIYYVMMTEKEKHNSHRTKNKL